MSRPALPAGYETGRERGAMVVALPSVFDEVMRAIRAHGTLYRAVSSRPETESFTGRGAAYRAALGTEQAVVRHYRRGGAIAGLLRDRYLRIGPPRPLRELHASVRARSRGVDTPEVLAAVIYAAPPFYRADIATRHVRGSRDLATAVLSDARADAGARLRMWRAAGELLHRTFDAGVEHADLNLRNILISGDEARALLIDLDRAVVRDHPISDDAQAAMLARLNRSRRKLEARYGSAASADELTAFAAGLASG